MGRAVGRLDPDGVRLRGACSAPPRLDVELETEAGVLKLRADNSNIVAYYVARGAPPKKFDPCKQLAGRSVEIVYRPIRGARAAGEILAVEMCDEEDHFLARSQRCQANLQDVSAWPDQGSFRSANDAYYGIRLEHALVLPP